MFQSFLSNFSFFFSPTEIESYSKSPHSFYAFSTYRATVNAHANSSSVSHNQLTTKLKKQKCRKCCSSFYLLRRYQKPIFCLYMIPEIDTNWTIDPHFIFFSKGAWSDKSFRCFIMSLSSLAESLQHRHQAKFFVVLL